MRRFYFINVFEVGCEVLDSFHYNPSFCKKNDRSANNQTNKKSNTKQRNRGEK